MSLNRTSLIYVAGHRGMAGGAVVRRLRQQGFENLLLASRSELDLTCQAAVSQFFAKHRPDVVVFAAARVGGIHANSTYPAEFLFQNLMMASNAVHAAWQHGTSRFLFLGSTCIYPRMAPQPIAESSLLTSELEPTNEAYAIAKIAGLKLCQFYRHQYGVLFHSAMPTNLYGPGDNYHPDNSHVLPALIRRFHEAKISGAEVVTIWGSGKPLREFLHVDDLAAGLAASMSRPRAGGIYNLCDDEPAPNSEVVAYAAGLLGIPSPPEVSLEDAGLSATAMRFYGESKRVSNALAKAELGWRPAYPTFREGLAAILATEVS